MSERLLIKNLITFYCWRNRFFCEYLSHIYIHTQTVRNPFFIEICLYDRYTYLTLTRVQAEAETKEEIKSSNSLLQIMS